MHIPQESSDVPVVGQAASLSPSIGDNEEDGAVKYCVVATQGAKRCAALNPALGMVSVMGSPSSFLCCRVTSVSLHFGTVFIFHCCPLSHTHSLSPRASFHLFNKREALQTAESSRTELRLLLGLNKNGFVPYIKELFPVACCWFVLVLINVCSL